MGPTNNVGYLLMHLVGVMKKQNDQALQEKLGIGFSQFKILMMLQHNPMIQQRQIADLLGQTDASISRQIKLLVDRKLLTSSVSPNNRREHLTALTEKGRQLVEKCLAVLNKTHAEMFEALGEEQREQLLKILNNMHRFTCQSGKTGACHPQINTYKES